MAVSKTSFTSCGGMTTSGTWWQLKIFHAVTFKCCACSAPSAPNCSCNHESCGTGYLRPYPKHITGNANERWLEIMSHLVWSCVCLGPVKQLRRMYHTSLRPHSHVFFCVYYRLSPSVPFTSRTLDKDTVLGDYAIPKGVSGLRL